VGNENGSKARNPERERNHPWQRRPVREDRSKGSDISKERERYPDQRCQLDRSKTRDDPAVRSNRAIAVTQRHACTHPEDKCREAADGK
jgi:hypothetical protein